MTDEAYAAAISSMTARIDRTAGEAAAGFPHYADPVTGEWTRSPDGDWTGGFWGGELWLAYHRTGDETYRRRALRWAERLRPRAASQTVFRGFLFYYGVALGALLGDDEAAGAIAVDGARGLATGFLPSVRAIPLGAQAEEASDVGDTELNIDGVPAVALLAWADDQRLREIAVSHARRHVELCVRDDGSVCQSASVSLDTGEVLRRYTHKGFSDDSTWTRAQAWAMVGYALAAHWLPDQGDFLATLVRVCDWWCDHLPASGVTFWDFDAPQTPGTRIDTSGAAIGAAALLKAAALIPDRAERYRATAESTVRALVADHLTPTGILAAGCYNHRLGLATDNELIWGSYYLYEALHVLTGTLDPLAV